MKSFRVITGLKLARRCNDIEIPKPKNVHARRGHSYQRRVAKSLKTLGYNFLYDQPFYFEDNKGSGYCIPDIVVIEPHRVVVIECKLTYKDEAHEKLKALYVPVVQFALMPGGISSLVVARNLTPASPVPSPSLEAALCQNTNSALIHWTGFGAFPIT